MLKFCMPVPALLQENPAAHQLQCARKIVAILFRATGLTAILRAEPEVIVGAANWISFDAGQPISLDAVLRLTEPGGRPAFLPDVFRRRRVARSRTNPSLHLTNLDSGQPLRGHVDAHYWASHPLAHAAEFLTRKTAEPSNLLQRLQT